MTLNDHRSRVGTGQLALLMGCVLAAAIPLYGQVALWTLLMLAGCAGVRLLYARRGWRLPSIWVKLVTVGVGVCGIALTFGTITGIEPGLSVLLVLVALKALETSSPRDFQVLTLLGFFLCLCALFFSQELNRWLYLAGVLLAFFGLLIAFHSRGAGMKQRRILKKTGIILLQALPLVVLLFAFFPRSYGGLRFQFGRSPVGFAGLGDRMEPGSIASLALREDVAFRADFPDGRIPPQSELYWRGMVLWRGNGLTWVRGGMLSSEQSEGSVTGEAVRQRIVLQPHGGRYIFALDRPTNPQRGMIMEPGGFLQSIRPVVSPFRYELTSRPINRERRLPSDQLDAALRTPQTISPRVEALAKSWREGATGDEMVVQRALEYFREGRFFYSLQPGTYDENGLEEFIFQRKIGFCEHYAGAFATLMRVAGVPSRVVLGYHGGQFNSLGQYVIVRQSDAHSWCEVWLKGVGWKRIDPTNVIAPERISAGLESYLQGQASGEGGASSSSSTGSSWRNALRDARFAWDNISYQWDLRVLNFDEDTQRSFFLMIGVGAMDLTSLSVFLAVVVILVVSTLALLLRQPKRQAESAAVRIYDVFCLLLAKRGVPREFSEGPKIYVDRAASKLPELAPAIQRVGDAYIDHRFARYPIPLAELVEAMKQFRRSLRTSPPDASANRKR